jgi:hypothetical protein
MDANTVINDTLLTLRDALLPHVLDAYRHRFGRSAFNQVIDALKSDRYTPPYASMDEARREIDPAECLNLILRRWKEVFRDKLDEECLSYVGELRQARNDSAHFKSAPTDPDLYRFVDTAVRLLNGFRALEVDVTAAVEHLSRTRVDLLQRMTTGQPTLPVQQQPAPPPRPPAPAAIFDADMEERIAALINTWGRGEIRAEVIRLLHLLKPDDPPLPIVIAPRDVTWTDDQPRLVIGAAEHFHRADGASPIMAALDRWESAGSPIRRAVFLIIDWDAALRLGELVRRWLALTRIGLMEGALAEADSSLRAGLMAVGEQLDAQIAAAYCWRAMWQPDGWWIDALPSAPSLLERINQAARTD